MNSDNDYIYIGLFDKLERDVEGQPSQPPSTSSFSKGNMDANSHVQ